MKHSSWSDWQTFVGFCAVCIVVAAFISWRIISAQTRQPAPRSALVSDQQVIELEPALAPSDKPVPVIKGTSKPTPENSELSSNVAKEALPRAKIATSEAATTVTLSGDTAVAPTVEDSPSNAVAVSLGKELFLHEWKPHDQLAGSGDGLGPVFNGRSCAECHSQGGLGGAGSNEHSVRAFEILPTKEGGEVRAGVIHSFATSVRDKEDVHALERHFRPGKVVVGLRQSGNGELTDRRDIDATRLVWINSPSLWGLGQIDRLSMEDLQRAVDAVAHQANKKQPDESNGHFRIHAEGKLGKFGWKGQFSSLKDFVAEACAGEIGLSNETARQYVPGEFRRDSQAEPDMNADQLASLVKFVSDLPTPKQVMPDDATLRAVVDKGQSLLESIGCTRCHIQNIGQVKNVYGDYRLHHVVDSFSESEEYYHRDFQLEIQLPPSYPKLDEWKTASLWGVADTAPYWHDGSAKTLEAAILRHAREAQPVIDSYRRLNRDYQLSMLAFLNTLHGPNWKE